ncbi:MAG: bifunctional phosphopantothenoylcysteine decarboxylase/phosphopantothenate--cysteine ligase CoaBC, partial [Campylobacter curvus]
VCDNVFMQTLIAASAVPFVIAPAANDKMISHFATQNSLEILKRNGASIVDPVNKILACGDEGKGGLSEPETIVYEAIRKLSEQNFKGKNVLVTGGATIEKIDDVRAITNLSSGKMARALADAFYFAGANVTLAASFEAGDLPYKVVKFRSSGELLKICQDGCKNADLLVMCAAVSDYVSKQKFSGKLKKEELGKQWSLKLVQNLDILNELAKFSCKKIGFKMEFDPANAKQSAQKMLLNKGLDAVCLNVITYQNAFGSEVNEVTFITKNGETQIKMAQKSEIAKQILDLTSKL